MVIYQPSDRCLNCLRQQEMADMADQQVAELMDELDDMKDAANRGVLFVVVVGEHRSFAGCFATIPEAVRCLVQREADGEVYEVQVGSAFDGGEPIYKAGAASGRCRLVDLTEKERHADKS